MISTSGYYFILLSMLASLIAILVRDTKAKLYAFFIGSLAPIAAFILLVIGFIISDFSVKNIFFNSSTIKPLLYKIAGSWSSHEGSMLLWFSLLSLVCMIYVKTAKLRGEIQGVQIAILAFIQILFGSFIFFTSNPFDSFIFTPKEGLGLNPMLQDVALSIHPPILYLGYVSYIVIFTNACLILFRPLEKTKLLYISKIFSNFALMSLSIGIGLGSWWAYRELGWGGFWFFDPVENISLLPWLNGIALHHFLLINIKYKKYIRYTILLSIFSFLLTLYGIFFVRSGIISSVHSFAFSPERGLYIFLICLILTFLSMLLFLVKHKRLEESEAKARATSIQQKAMLYSNILWIISLISLLIAIIYPIYYSFIHGSDIAIDPEYYKQVFIPLYIPLMLLASITPYLENRLHRRHLLFFAISLVTILGIDTQIELGLITKYILVSAIFLMIQTIDYLLVSTSIFSKNLKASQLALFLGHFGMGFLAFSIAFNVVLARDIAFTGTIGDIIESEDLKVRLESVKFADSTSYYRQIAEFSVQDRHGNIVNLKPENRFYKIEKSLSQEADIFSFLTHDLYAVLGKIDGKTIQAEIYYRPLIGFIWLSILILASSFGVLLLSKK